MRKLTVINHMSLDGVMQAPAGPDEDTRGGFGRGGGRRDNPYTEVLNKQQKYVASRTLTELFPEGAPADLRLAESVTTTTGVIIARYQTR